MHRLSDSLTRLKVQGVLSDLPSLGISCRLKDPHDPYLSLLAEFPAVTQPTSNNQPVKHTVTHHIHTSGQPVAARTRHLAPEKLRIARHEFPHMIDLGIIRPSSSNWSSPLHLVPKKTGDYRALNRTTIPGRYPIPHLQDFTAGLQGTIVFSISTMSGHSIKSLSSLVTFQRLPSRHRSDCTSSSACLLVCVTQHRHSKGLWMRCCVG